MATLMQTLTLICLLELMQMQCGGADRSSRDAPPVDTFDSHKAGPAEEHSCESADSYADSYGPSAVSVVREWVMN